MHNSECVRTSFFRSLRKKEDAPLMRLYCFSYAGGGGSMFRKWAAFLPSGIEICPIVLPGRERRLKEELYRNMKPLVEDLLAELRPQLEVPHILFGHSLGAAVAFELSRMISREVVGARLLRLVVSGCRPPHFWQFGTGLSELTTSQFLQELKKMGGLPEEILASPELLQIVLPVLKADFEVLDSHTFVPGALLECPITAFGGSEDDKVPREALAEWKKYTIGEFDYVLFSGGHFFVERQTSEFVPVFSKLLENTLYGISSLLPPPTAQTTSHNRPD